MARVEIDGVKYPAKLVPRLRGGFVACKGKALFRTSYTVLVVYDGNVKNGAGSGTANQQGEDDEEKEEQVDFTEYANQVHVPSGLSWHPVLDGDMDGINPDHLVTAENNCRINTITHSHLCIARAFDPSSSSTVPSSSSGNNNKSEYYPVCPELSSGCVRPDGATAEVGHAQNTCATHSRYEMLLFNDEGDTRLKWKHAGQGVKASDGDGGDDSSNEEEEEKPREGMLPHGAVQAGVNEKGEKVYVARARIDGRFVPGKVRVPLKSEKPEGEEENEEDEQQQLPVAHFAVDGHSYERKRYAVLCIVPLPPSAIAEKKGEGNNDDAERKAQVKVPDGLLWAPSQDGIVPDNAVVFELGSSSSSSDNKRMFVARASLPRELAPGGVATGQSCVVPYFGKIPESQRYDVLTTDPAVNVPLLWVHAKGGEFPDGAVQAGVSNKGDQIFVARGVPNDENVYRVGKFRTGFRNAFVAGDAKEKSVFRYDVLCIRTPGNQDLPADAVVCGFDAVPEEEEKDGNKEENGGGQEQEEQNQDKLAQQDEDDEVGQEEITTTPNDEETPLVSSATTAETSSLARDTPDVNDDEQGEDEATVQHTLTPITPTPIGDDEKITPTSSDEIHIPICDEETLSPSADPHDDVDVQITKKNNEVHVPVADEETPLVTARDAVQSAATDEQPEMETRRVEWTLFTGDFHLGVDRWWWALVSVAVLFVIVFGWWLVFDF